MALQIGSIKCDLNTVRYAGSFLTPIEHYNIIIRSRNEKPITLTIFI